MERTGLKRINPKGGALQIREFEREVARTFGPEPLTPLQKAKMLAADLIMLSQRAREIGYSIEELAELSLEEKN